MSNQDAIRRPEAAQRLRTPQIPVCPQLRAAEEDGHYPIGGYCVGACAGCLMIPTIEEYRTWCTTACFRECRWFRGAAVIDERKAA